MWRYLRLEFPTSSWEVFRRIIYRSLPPWQLDQETIGWKDVTEAVLNHEAMLKRFEPMIAALVPQLHHSPAVTAMFHLPVHMPQEVPNTCFPCLNLNCNCHQSNQHFRGPSRSYQVDNYLRQQYGSPPSCLGYASQFRVSPYAKRESSGESLRCYYCGKLGHTQNVCFNKFPYLRPAWMIEEERQRSFARSSGQDIASGANTSPLGEQQDNRRNQVWKQHRIEFHDNARHDTRPSNNHYPGQERLNQSPHTAASVLECGYSCDIQRDTLHFEHAFATVHTGTSYNYSIENARLFT